MTYLPALDGVRGLAVAAVLLFHGGFVWMEGGFLGVSTFFTLSGFLITSLLLHEHERSERIDLKGFWLRRFRRLMPAALAALLVALAFGHLLADATQRANLRADVVGSLLYVANWRFVFSDQAYAGLFDSPSPVLHFWSLAIEEQFYLLYPLVVFGALSVLHWSRKRFGVLVIVLAIVSASIPFFIPMSDDRIYFGTDTRAAELLLGVLAAVWLARWPLGRPVLSRPAGRAVSAVGIVAVVVTVACWVLLDQGSAVLYRGGFLAYGLASAALVVSASVVGTPLARALGVAPLRELGRISYGVYLYHWPIFLVLSPERTGLDGWALFSARVAVTLAASVVSFRFLEMPIRRGERPFRIANWKVAPAAASLVLVLAVSTSAGTGSGDTELEQSGPVGPIDVTAVVPDGDFAPPVTSLPPGITRTSAGPLVPRASKTPSRPLRLLVLGDSTAVSIAQKLHPWGRVHGVFEVYRGGQSGCAIVRGGSAVGANNGRIRVARDTGDCNWEQNWRADIDRVDPDVIVVATGMKELMDYIPPGSDDRVALGNPEHDERVRAEYEAAADFLAAEQIPVLWLDVPPTDYGRGVTYEDGEEYAASDPFRVTRLNEIVSGVVAERSGFVKVSYGRFFDAWPGGAFDRWLRHDGVHLADEGGPTVVGWLGPELLASYWDAVSTSD